MPRQFGRRFGTPAGKQAQVYLAGFQRDFTCEPGMVGKVWLFQQGAGAQPLALGTVLPEPDTGNGDALPHRGVWLMGRVCTQILSARMKTAIIGENAAGIVYLKCISGGVADALRGGAAGLPAVSAQNERQG